MTFFLKKRSLRKDEGKKSNRRFLGEQIGYSRPEKSIVNILCR